MIRGASVLGLIVLASQLPSPAGEGRIPLYSRTTISEPGYYVLTRDLDGLSGGIGITVSANDVTVDLGGHRIEFTAPGYGVWVNAGFSRVTVRNGTIVAPTIGVYYHSASMRTRMALENLTVIDAESQALRVYGADQVEVVDCVVGTVNADAIYLHGVSGPFEGGILRNTVYRAGGAGIYTAGAQGMEIRDNNVRDVGQVSCCYHGLELSSLSEWTAGGNHVIGNSFRYGRSNDSIGIVVRVGSNRNLIKENVIEGNTGDGIWVLGDANRIVGNIIAANQHGVVVEGTRNLVEGNLIEGNSLYGIWITNTNGHAYRDNMLRGNTEGPNTGGAADADQGGNIR